MTSFAQTGTPRFIELLLSLGGQIVPKKLVIRTFWQKVRACYPASGGGAASGIATVNVVPFPSLVFTDAWPPWASAIDATMASPSPAPPTARERALSTR